MSGLVLDGDLDFGSHSCAFAYVYLAPLIGPLNPKPVPEQ